MNTAHYFQTTDGERTTGYYFDRVRINFFHDLPYLKSFLPTRELRRECKHFKLSEAAKRAKFYSMESAINMTVPARRCFQILSEHLDDPAQYKISFLEITRDVICESMDEAFKRQDFDLRYLRKNKTIVHRIFDGIVDNRKKYSKGEKDLPGYFTGYHGTKTFQYVSYPRPSKIDGRPCFHSEWRINLASAIKAKTGIKTISDLMKFDFVAFFKKHDKQTLRHEEIDEMKLGKWLEGCPKKKKYVGYDFMNIGLAARTFLEAYEIKTTADLYAHFQKWIRELRKRGGPYSTEEQRVLRIKNFKRQFTRPPTISTIS